MTTKLPFRTPKPETLNSGRFSIAMVKGEFENHASTILWPAVPVLLWFQRNPTREGHSVVHEKIGYRDQRFYFTDSDQHQRFVNDLDQIGEDIKRDRSSPFDDLAFAVSTEPLELGAAIATKLGNTFEPATIGLYLWVADNCEGRVWHNTRKNGINDDEIRYFVFEKVSDAIKYRLIFHGEDAAKPKDFFPKEV